MTTCRPAILVLAGTLVACASTPTQPSSGVAMPADNPFFHESTLPLKYPPFDQIRDEHFATAFDRGMAEQLAEVEAIATSDEPPTFENTIVALEKSGRTLTRVQTYFFNLIAADLNDARKVVQTEVSPKLAGHHDAIFLNGPLFERIEALYARRGALGLDPEAERLLERYHVDFVRAGAQLSEGDKAKLRAMNEELAELRTQFTQNVLAEVNEDAIVVDNVSELAGLPEAQIAAAAEAAKARGLDAKWVLALKNTTTQPPNAYLDNRDLRHRVFEASVARGSNGDGHDTTGIVSRIARLRAERAQMLGFANHAAYVIADATAKTPAAVNERLAQLAPPALRNAKREAKEIQSIIVEEGGSFDAQPWDWQYYSEHARKAKYDFDGNVLKPYLELDRVLKDGVFYAAGKLYGLRFEERTDLPVYHPDVRVFDVLEEDGTQLAIFLFDPYARESKKGGAWMNAYVRQTKLLDQRAVVANHLNIDEPPEGQPTLLTWDEVITAFHEFGHALHGMFSNVTYPAFAGTSVPRDFVEYPSQVNEMWATWPEVLKHYARHYQTGEPLPPELVQKILDTKKFNQGFATSEYLEASLVDQALHQLSPDEVPSADQILTFEAEALKKSGMEYPLVPPRYHLPYFSHIMGDYSAGYYSYIWAEVLDADTAEWFEENGGLKRENGDTFRKEVLSRGFSIEPMQQFFNLRGRDPDIRPLLERRGLTPVKGSKNR